MGKPFEPFGTQLLIQAGFNPNNGLPIKYGDDNIQNLVSPLKESIKRNIKILDEQTAIRRYVWYNLPAGLTSELVERILYYRGQGMLFYMEEDENFYFLPFTPVGKIDVYGQFKNFTPLPFNGSTESDEDQPWIEGMDFKAINNMSDVLNIKEDEDITKYCFILTDYTKQISQHVIPRSILNEDLIDLISEIIPICETGLIANSGAEVIKVMSEDEASEASKINSQIKSSILNGMPFIPFKGTPETEVISSNTGVMRFEDQLAFMQSLENLRLSFYGLKNGGLFQKKAHMLQDEQEVNDGNIGLIYEDGLICRQNFCDLINAVWDLGVYCLPSETVTGFDRNSDGYLGDTKDQSGVPGEQSNQNVEV